MHETIGTDGQDAFFDDEFDEVSEGLEEEDEDRHREEVPGRLHAAPD